MKKHKLKATVVFERNWDAINLKCFFVKKLDDNGRLEVFIEPTDNTKTELESIGEFDFDLSQYRLDEYPETSYLADVNKVAPEELHKYMYNRYKYILNRGSSRSSKTVSLIDCYDLYARKNRGKRLTAWRDTKKSCKDTVLKDSLKHHKLTGRYKKGYWFNKTDSIFYYNNDSTVEICGTDDEESVHGFTQDGAWLNEPYKISKDTFDQIDQRTSDFILLDLNPKKNHWSDKLQHDPRTIIIHSDFRMNPFCPVESRRKLLSYQPLSWAQVVLDGKIDVDQAFNYDIKKNPFLFTRDEISELVRCRQNEIKETSNAYKWQVYGLGLKAEKPNKIYSGWKLLNPIDFDKLPYKSFFGLDFGETNPTALVECKYNDGTFYFKEILYRPGKEIKSLSTLLDTYGIIKGEDIIVCDSASPDKIGELRGHGYYAIGANKGPGSVVAGISFLNKLKVRYTQGSKNITDEYEDYEWEIDRYGLPLDKPIKKDDHLMDAMRYVVDFLKTHLGIKV